MMLFRPLLSSQQEFKLAAMSSELSCDEKKGEKSRREPHQNWVPISDDGSTTSTEGTGSRLTRPDVKLDFELGAQ